MAPQVYVIGLGHIGLPLACWVAASGHTVVGVDVSRPAVESIREGRVTLDEYLGEEHISDVALRLQKQGVLFVDESLTRTDDDPVVFLVAVGLAGDGRGAGDYAPLLSAIDQIAGSLRDGDLVLVRTTLVPGTCAKIIAPRLAASGKKAFLAYCPETMAESHAFDELAHNPMVLAADDEDSYRAAEHFIASLTGAPILRAPDMKTAEMAKVVQNIIRDVDIALANEISDAARRLGVDPVALRRAVNSHPRVKMLMPGPGVGGYCLPNALGYLAASIPHDGRSAPSLVLSSTARALNALRPSAVVELVRTALAEAGKDLRHARVAVLGLGMKDYCSDVRLSPAVCLVQALSDAGASVTAFDPAVAPSFPFQASTLQGSVADADAVVVAVKQRGLSVSAADLARAMAQPPVIVDTRDCLADCEGIRIFRL